MAVCAQLQVVALESESIVLKGPATKGHMSPIAVNMDSTSRNQEQSMVGLIGNLLMGKMQSGTLRVLGSLVDKVPLESFAVISKPKKTTGVWKKLVTLGDTIPQVVGSTLRDL